MNTGILAVQGDLTMAVLTSPPDPHYGYYEGIFNTSNGPNTQLQVAGNWYDPNPLGEYHGGLNEGDYHPLRMVFNGGGPVQTLFSLKNDAEARLEVASDSHLQLDSDFTSTYPYPNPGGTESSLHARSTLDLGSHDLTISRMLMFQAEADAPTIIYAAGADSGIRMPVVRLSRPQLRLIGAA